MSTSSQSVRPSLVAETPAAQASGASPFGAWSAQRALATLLGVLALINGVSFASMGAEGTDHSALMAVTLLNVSGALILRVRSRPTSTVVTLTLGLATLSVGATAYFCGRDSNDLTTLFLIVAFASLYGPRRQAISLTLFAISVWGAIAVADASLTRYELGRWAVGSLILLFVMWLITRLRRRVFDLASHLEARAHQDELTGVLNRRGLAEAFEREAARSLRTGDPFGLLLIDVNDFKAINDLHGHLAGDTALRDLAATLRRETRPTDVVARLGGDEFAVILTDCSGDDLEEAIERIDTALEQSRGQSPFPTTVSIGAAVRAPDGKQLQDLLAVADRAMYRAKAGSRPAGAPA